ncbi:MAG: (Fe-S)-binding protein [Dehalococcoidia bacterium]
MTEGYDILNTCVHCGLCLPHCPTYRETYREQSSPRGRLRLMRSVYEGRLDVLDPVFSSQMYECLDCRACEAVCPSGVLYGQVLEPARAQIEQARATRGKRSLAERLLRWAVFERLFANMRLFRAASAAARLYQRSGLQRLARASGLLRLLKLDFAEGQLPRMSRRFFVPRGQVFSAHGERRGRVGLLAGCIMHTAYAEIDRASVRVLRRNGWEVVVPAAQGCCGALHIHAGEAELGRALMQRNVAAFESADVDFVVNNAAGCGAALKEYGHLLRDDTVYADRAQAFSAKVRDITELLAEQPLRGTLGRLKLTVTYQEPCHLAHAQRISAAPRALLRAIPGLTLVEMNEASLCCGSAGIYSVTQPEMSGRLVSRKLDNALATSATVIASANPGCILQLGAGLRRLGAERVQVRHIIEVLDASYRRGDTGPAPRPIGVG